MGGFLVGQERVERALVRATASGRLAHGLLFAGPVGVGRERAALGLAAGLLCERRRDSSAHTPWGCGDCRTCRRARTGNHPDLHVLMSEAEAVRRGLQAADGKRRPSADILVDAVRDLAIRLRMAPFEGGARVAVVLDAHRMNANAQNALLKTLEEPPERTWIVLVVPHERTVLPTIASRCLRLSFAPLTQADIAAVLRSRGDPDADARAQRADGSLAQALAVDLTAAEGQGRALLQVLLSGSAAERMDAAEALGKERADVDAALTDLEKALAHALREDVRAVSPHDAGGRVTWRQARSLLESTRQARNAIAQNASVQLCLERLFLSPAPFG